MHIDIDIDIDITIENELQLYIVHHWKQSQTALTAYASCEASAVKR